MKKFQTLLIILLVGFGVTMNGQDIHFSQFYLAPLQLNPAMTGAMSAQMRFSANYRNQWGSILRENAFNTYSAGFDMRVPIRSNNDNFGWGINLWGDRAGEVSFQTVQGKGSFSYSKMLSRSRSSAQYLNAGAEIGVSQRSLDFTKAQWGAQWNGEVWDGAIDPNEPWITGNTNLTFLDVGAGLLWYSVFDEQSSIYVGAAFAHLNQANQSFNDFQNIYEPFYTRITFHAGGEFPISQQLGIAPDVVLFKQGPSMMLNTGANIRFRLGRYSGQGRQAFQVGAFLRNSNHNTGFGPEALMFTSRFDYDAFTLGFSYDATLSSLKAANNGVGGFEFALQYRLDGNDSRGMGCPNNF